MASRELEYRRIRRDAFRDRYGLNPGDTVSLHQLEEIFNATNTDKEVKALFEKVIALAKSLGVEVKVEENDGEERDTLGKANLNREVYLFIEPRNTYEFVSQMADPGQMALLDLPIWIDF